MVVVESSLRVADLSGAAHSMLKTHARFLKALVRISCPDGAVAEGLGPAVCESRAHIHSLILQTDTVWY